MQGIERGLSIVPFRNRMCFKISVCNSGDSLNITKDSLRLGLLSVLALLAMLSKETGITVLVGEVSLILIVNRLRNITMCFS